MENFFINEWYDWRAQKPSSRLNTINKLLAKLGLYSRLQYPRHTGVMTNIEQRINLYHLVSQVLAYNVPGAIVELGCNDGQSSTVIQKIIQHFDPSREFHVYDSFEGLPPLHEKDAGTERFAEGQMKTTRETLLSNFKTLGLPPPVVHPGWFDKTLPTELPEAISFAYLDGDFYESILVSLRYTYPRLSKGAICLIDDYSDPSVFPTAWNMLPGVKRACDEFLADKPEKMSLIYSDNMSHGFFRKL